MRSSLVALLVGCMMVYLRFGRALRIDLILFKPDVKHIPNFYTYRDIPPRYPYLTEPRERIH